MPAAPPPTDPTDEQLVADALAAVEADQGRAHGVGYDRIDLALRSYALRKLPVDVAAQLLRREIADALAIPEVHRRPDHLFHWLMTHEGAPVTIGQRTVEAEDGSPVTLTVGPARMLLLPPPDTLRRPPGDAKPSL